MQITVTQTHDFPLRRRYVLELHSETGEVVSKGNFHLVKTGFGDGTVDTMLCSGVATPMQHAAMAMYGRSLIMPWTGRQSKGSQ